MMTFLAIVHVLLALGVIFFVLLQDPKGGAMGVFGTGGGSNSFFGSTGATSFLNKATRWIAIFFAGSCLLLAYLTAHNKNTSVLDNFVPPAGVNAPATKPSPPAAEQKASDADGNKAEPAK